MFFFKKCCTILCQQIGASTSTTCAQKVDQNAALLRVEHSRNIKICRRRKFEGVKKGGWVGRAHNEITLCKWWLYSAQRTVKEYNKTKNYKTFNHFKKYSDSKASFASVCLFQGWAGQRTISCASLLPSHFIRDANQYLRGKINLIDKHDAI